MVSEQDLVEVLKRKKETLQVNFKPGFLDRPETLFQFLFDQDEAFSLFVTESDFEFTPGQKSPATLTLNMKDHSTCWGLLEGSINGMDAFMNGTYRADGNIVLSQLILYLFKSNDPTIAYEVQD